MSHESIAFNDKSYSRKRVTRSEIGYNDMDHVDKIF